MYPRKQEQYKNKEVLLNKRSSEEKEVSDDAANQINQLEQDHFEKRKQAYIKVKRISDGMLENRKAKRDDFFSRPTFYINERFNKIDNQGMRFTQLPQYLHGVDHRTYRNHDTNPSPSNKDDGSYEIMRPKEGKESLGGGFSYDEFMKSYTNGDLQGLSNIKPELLPSLTFIIYEEKKRRKNNRDSSYNIIPVPIMPRPVRNYGTKKGKGKKA